MQAASDTWRTIILKSHVWPTHGLRLRQAIPGRFLLKRPFTNELHPQRCNVEVVQQTGAFLQGVLKTGFLELDI